MKQRNVTWGAPTFDKQVHRDELRLRLLLTNACNKSCSYCLNDFMPKDLQLHMLSQADISHALSAHSKVCDDKGYEKKLALSGGEPGLNKRLAFAIHRAKDLGYSVTVCTNGLAYVDLIEEGRQAELDMVDDWHVSVHDLSLSGSVNAERALLGLGLKAEATLVMTKEHSLHTLLCTIGEIKAKTAVTRVKIFSDFNETADWYDNTFVELVNAARDTFPDMKIKSRFTGVQENRGRLCDDCDRRCITLKAMWVRPDGSVSACPQFKRRLTFRPGLRHEWRDVAEIIEQSHKA